MKAYKLCLISVFPVALIAMILQIAAFQSARDPGTNYFVRGTALPVLAGCFAGLAILLGGIGAFLRRKEGQDGGGQTAALPSAFCISAAIGSLGTAINGLFCSSVQIPIPFLKAADQTVREIQISKTIFILFLVFAVFWALCATPLAKKHGDAIAWIGFVGVFAPIFLLASYYFDPSVEMNAPVKVLLQIGMIAVMFYTTAEIRCLLRRAHPLMYPIFASMAVVCGSIASIPIQVGARTTAGSESIYLAAVPALFGIAVTAAIRLFLWIFRPASAESEPSKETPNEPSAAPASAAEPNPHPASETAEKTANETGGYEK